MSIQSYLAKKTSFGLILWIVLVFFAGALSCWVLFYFVPNTSDTSNSRALRLTQTNYPLINPLLICNLEPKGTNENKWLEDKVSEFIRNRVSQGLVQNMSVYIIDYSLGSWSGVGQNDRYDPASMLKVPIMMAYYAYTDRDQNILSEKTSFVGDDQNVGEYFKSKQNILPGKMYTVGELIQSMIINSDNTAATLLSSYIDQRYLSSVYTDIGLPSPVGNGASVEYMSPKIYSYFFRLLYNSTYLSREYSEKSLDLLTHTNMSQIRLGAPSSIIVAQKFGERSSYDTSGKLQNRELHDCGIVYKTGSPYFLCIMSRGQDFDQLAKNINDLGALVYQNIGVK